MYQDQVQVAPKQEGEIHSMLSQLDQSLEALMDSVNTMQYRLEPVMRASEPQVSDKENAQRCPTTQVSERIQLYIYRVLHANDVLRDSISRLEV